MNHLCRLPFDKVLYTPIKYLFKMKTVYVIPLVLLMACTNNRASQSEAPSYPASSEVGAAVAPPALQSEPSAPMSENQGEASEDPSFGKKDLEHTPGLPKLVIKNADYTIKARDIEASKARINQLVKQNQAYYFRDKLENSQSSITYNLVIRVPVSKFELFIEGLDGGGDEILNKNIYADDVTEEYMDVASRLKTKHEFLDQYRSLLHKALKVEDILSIQENIRAIQEEIESKEGRLKYLQDQVDFSTITIALVKDKPYVYKAEEADKFSERVKKSFDSGWKSTVDLVIWFFSLWPFWLLIYVFYLIFRRWLRKKRKLAANN